MQPSKLLLLCCTALVGCNPALVVPPGYSATYQQSVEIAENARPIAAKNYFPHRSDLARHRPDSPAQVRIRYMPEIPLNFGPLDSELEVWFVVEVDGVVRESILAVSCGKKEVDDLYVAAVRSWKFSPAEIDGKPIAQQTRQPFRIKLY